jgi:hypothetical protein
MTDKNERPKGSILPECQLFIPVKVVHFRPESLVQFGPESLVQFGPESLAHFTPELLVHFELEYLLRQKHCILDAEIIALSNAVYISTS